MVPEFCQLNGYLRRGKGQFNLPAPLEPCFEPLQALLKKCMVEGGKSVMDVSNGHSGQVKCVMLTGVGREEALIKQL